MSILYYLYHKINRFIYEKRKKENQKENEDKNIIFEKLL